MSNPHRLPTLAGLLGIALLVLANASYSFLVARFGYDDILREPPAAVLAAFRNGGPQLVLAWLGFSLSALSIAVLAPLLDRAIALRWNAGAPLAASFGMLSGFAQAIGLARWVFVVPVLARMHAEGDEATRAAVETAFATMHAFAGVAIGEFLGQALLLLWTAGASHALWRAGGNLRWIALFGFLSLPCWIVGYSELLATVIPGIPAIEAAPVAFMVWQVWVLALCVGLLLPRRLAYPLPR